MKNRRNRVDERRALDITPVPKNQRTGGFFPNWSYRNKWCDVLLCEGCLRPKAIIKDMKDDKSVDYTFMWVHRANTPKAFCDYCGLRLCKEGKNSWKVRNASGKYHFSIFNPFTWFRSDRWEIHDMAKWKLKRELDSREDSDEE